MKNGQGWRCNINFRDASLDGMVDVNRTGTGKRARVQGCALHRRRQDRHRAGVFAARPALRRGPGARAPARPPWFVAYAPAENPKIALAVLVENGGFGAQSAAPIARQVIDYYLLDQRAAAPAAEDEEGAESEEAAEGAGDALPASRAIEPAAPQDAPPRPCRRARPPRPPRCPRRSPPRRGAMNDNRFNPLALVLGFLRPLDPVLTLVLATLLGYAHVLMQSASPERLDSQITHIGIALAGMALAWLKPQRSLSMAACRGFTRCCR